MSDYYNLPPPKKRRGYGWVYLVLLLLFLLGLYLTWLSVRLKPGEIGFDPMLTAAAAPAPATFIAPGAPPPVVEPVEAPEPIEEPPEAPVEPEALLEPDAAEPEVEPEAEPEPPPPLFSDASWRETARFTGLDAAGRSAEFTAYVLVSEETWTFARADAVFAAGLSQPVDTAFAKLNLGPGICTLSRVIAVGAASVEGTSEMNTLLSHTRGHALKASIAGNLPCEAGVLPVSVLDLGYSRAEVTCPGDEPVCPDVSAPQRPIAMIFVQADDPETDIHEALRTGIEAHEAAGASVLPGVSVADYSAFDLR